MENDFDKYGATPELIQKLCNVTNATIKIYDVVSMSYTKYRS